MNVGFVGPLQRAVARARSMLFRPFRLETWLTLGFAAFLSEWVSGGWSHGGWQYRLGSSHRGGLDGTLSGLHGVLPALVWGPLLLGILVVAVTLAVVMMWLGARGKFVFLDDVVRGRAAIVEPWRRFARLGNSLFLWQLGFTVAWVAVMFAIVFGTIGTAVLGWLGLREPVAMAPPIAGGVLLAILLALVVTFVTMLLDEFVAPIMYRHGLSATDAWRRFLPLLRQRFGTFLLYALFLLLLNMALVAAVAAAGFATCCVGFFLVGAPYVGQVVLLPVYVALRGLGPEFLAQFGADYDAFAAPAAEPGSWTPV